MMFFSVISFSQGTENFTNLPSDPGTSTSYINRSWTGTDGNAWTGNGRKDRTITAGNPALCMGGTVQGAGFVQSPTYAGGIGTLTFKAVRDFASTNTRTLRVFVNNVQQGADITVDPNSDVANIFTQTLNISGNVVLRIESVGLNQVKIDDLSWNGYVSTTPVISVVSSGLNPFVYVAGNGPSSSQSIQVSGLSLVPASGDLTVTAPANYEVSLDNLNFASSQLLSYIGGTLTTQNVYVRLKAGLSFATYNESVVVSGGGATSVNVALTGRVVKPFSIPYTNAYATQTDYNDSVLQGLVYSSGMIFTTTAGGFLNVALNEYLETPTIDFTAQSFLALYFDMRDFGGATGQKIAVMVSENNGATYTTLNTFTMTSGYLPYFTLINLVGSTSTTGKIKIQMTEGTNSVRVRNLKIYNPAVWNGTSWSNIVGPSLTLGAVINGNYSTLTNGEFSAEYLCVNSGIMTVDSGDLITVQNEIRRLGTSQLILQNDANVIQNTNSINIGSVEVRRNSSPMKRLDYTAWSSPVNGQNLLNFSPNTVLTRFYTYNPATNAWDVVASPSTTNFLPSVGYLIRVDNTWNAVTPSPYNGVFVGSLRNGNYSSALTAGFNLVGNPYPSPINATTFIADNNSVNGLNTLYFWTHEATTNGFASYAGGVGVPAISGGVVPDGTIQIGQGFLVNPTSAANSVFNNNQRLATNTGQFIRSSNTSTSVTRDLFRLSLRTDANPYNQIAIYYKVGASNQVDNLLDAPLFTNALSNISSLIDNNKYVIQARTGELDLNDEVALSFVAEQNGIYAIKIDGLEGVFANGQNIYLKDNLLNVIHDIKANEYSFTSEAGTFNNRFSIVYKNSVLSQEVFNDTNLVVYKSNESLIIKSTNSVIQSVVVYDVQGRNILSKNVADLNEVNIDAVKTNNQVLLVEVTTNKGKEIKKVIF